MRRGSRRLVATTAVLLVVAGAAAARAATALVDLDDGELLESNAANVPVTVGRAGDLLLVYALRERITAGALAYDASVPVLAVRGDPGPRVSARDLPVHELLQLLLLADSRTAARSLTAAIGPGEERGRARLRACGDRLGLRHTQLPDTWPAAAISATDDVAAPARFRSGSRAGPAASARVRAAVPSAPASTAVGDLARLAVAIFRDPAMRRRLALDGVPVANGATIVRATAPLIVLMDATTPAAHPSLDDTTIDRGPALVIGSRSGLDLIAIAAGPAARDQARAALARGLDRYQRVEIVRTGEPVGRKVKVHDGIIPWFNAVAAQPFAVTLPRTRGASVRLILQLPGTVEAPLEVEQPVGELVIARGSRVLGAVPLVVPLAVAPSRWIDTARE